MKDYKKIAKEILDSMICKSQVKEIDYDGMYKQWNQILMQWKFMWVDYLILFYGDLWHPCAYFKIPSENNTVLKRLVLSEWYDAVPFQTVNWWFTFGRNIKEADDLWFTPWVWLGWDYAHCDDYCCYRKDLWFPNLKKRKTEEILEEVIEQIYALADNWILNV